jgi:YVTN family beta-propeller protein
MALAVLVLVAVIFAGLSGPEAPVSAQGGGRLAVSQSSPIAVTSDNRLVWVANWDNDTVSVIDVTNDANKKIAEIPVGREPQSVAISPDNRAVYVTNRVGGTVTVLNAQTGRTAGLIYVGVEPFGCALTADGRKLYVANFASSDVAVIDTTRNELIRTIPVPAKPFAIAIQTSGVSDKVYVTHFQAFLRPDSRTVVQKEGRDDGKEGRVTVISTASDTVIGTTVLNPVADVGFAAAGSVLDRVPATAGNRPTGAFPNLLESIAIKGNRVYVPNTASSPNGPVRFNVNVQSFLSVVDTINDQEVQTQTINMNRGVQFEAVGKKLFITTPIGIAFKRGANEGYVVSAATDRLVRVQLDTNGAPTINAPLNANDPGSIIRIAVGKNPRGICINSTDTRAYVMNFVSRDVSVVDIQTGSPRVNTEIARVSTAALPASGSLAAIVLRGKELFNSGIGPAGTQENALPPAGRLSDFGWGACYNCHPNGQADGVTWMFGDGPRQTISMESTFNHPQPPTCVLNAFGSPTLPSCDQRPLNWSAVRDEVQDFELNIRNVSGGQGLITDGLGVFNLTPTANTGRGADEDAITAYIAFGIRAPISPAQWQKRVGLGNPEFARSVFARANCQGCHGGTNWTRSRLDFTPPPAANEIVAAQLVRFLKPVGTFDPNAFNEIKPDLTVANGALGINIPSLIGVFNSAPYLHNGSAQTLDEVLENVVHRSAGTGGIDTLRNPFDRSELVRFLKTIDASTPPFN